jgi:septum formation protein
MSSAQRLILASASPRRRQILSDMGVPFDVCPSELPEPAEKPADLAPAAWAEALAHFKARPVAESHPGRFVLGADTIVVCDGHLLGKPCDLDDARRMLVLQAGRETDVITGIALLGPGIEGDRILRHAVTKVWMRDDAAQREAYLRSGDWQGKSGAYGIQTVGDRLVERIEGGFSNVVGLPDELVRRLLIEIGFLRDGTRECNSNRPDTI